MKHKTRSAALALAALMACGVCAGCDLVTTSAKRDYEQVIAEVDISRSEDFAAGGKYAAYKSAVETAEITKRDMVLSFASNGSSLMNQLGWTYSATFEAICNSLVNRQVLVQYAKVYFLANESETYTVAGYEAAVKDKTGVDRDVAGLSYFLTEEEEEKALYDLRVSFNGSLDSLEQSIIAELDREEDEDHDHDTTVRTTPTGVGTENEDYFDPEYRIYTGTQKALGTYEKVDGSLPATRKKAYAQFLTNLRTSGFLVDGEDTTRLEEMTYFKEQLRTVYQNALTQKLTDIYEEEAAASVTDEWLATEYASILANQKSGFEAGTTTVDTALDSMSDTSFVLTSPTKGYGFVINILLPFSAMQSQELADVTMDANDPKGNKFVTRAKILERLTATDQRGTWFTGEEDYSFESEEGYSGSERKYLFFEDALKGDGEQYEQLKNYYGKYPYLGTVTVKDEDENGHKHYTVKPTKISIDGFLDEMEGYLKFALGDDAVETGARGGSEYYAQTSYYGEDGEVDYSKFVYTKGKVVFDGGFDANEIFFKGSEENTALSVINELSFAYNTDTAGLNTYLGYTVTPDKTDFVAEFEYAAQTVCKEGAGSYIVVPSDYGWHIIYCTFSFTTDGATPFTYDASLRDKEGTFSNLFFEAKKTEAIENYSNYKQTEVRNSYAKIGSTVYKDRYQDLLDLDNA